MLLVMVFVQDERRAGSNSNFNFMIHPFNRVRERQRGYGSRFHVKPTWNDTKGLAGNAPAKKQDSRTIVLCCHGNQSVVAGVHFINYLLLLNFKKEDSLPPKDSGQDSEAEPDANGSVMPWRPSPDSDDMHDDNRTSEP
jgi:hypothetical protein